MSHPGIAPQAPTILGSCSQLLPGLALVGVLTALAFAVRQIPGAAVLSPMIIGIVLGMGVGNLAVVPAPARAGIAFAMRRLLRLAIILLGLQLTAAQIVDVGAVGIAIIALTLLSTFAFTVFLGRRLGVDAKLAELIAAGTSICGASAVICTNTVTRAGDEDVAYAVACVTVFGSIAMLLYPFFPGLLHLEARAFGLWSGASIHEIAQVVAAAFQAGREAGEFGTIAKLSRVMMLAPMVIGLGLLAARRASTAGVGAAKARAPMPWFVLGFIALVGLNSIAPITPEARSAAAMLTTVLLTMALAAMGLETDFSKLRAKGMRPLLLGAASSLFIAGFSLALVKLAL